MNIVCICMDREGSSFAAIVSTEHTDSVGGMPVLLRREVATPWTDIAAIHLFQDMNDRPGAPISDDVFASVCEALSGFDIEITRRVRHLEDRP